MLESDGNHDYEIGKALVATGKAAIPFLQPILEDGKEALLFKSGAAAMSLGAQYRRKDFAYRYMCLILAHPYSFDMDPTERDKNIEKLKNTLKEDVKPQTEPKEEIASSQDMLAMHSLIFSPNLKNLVGAGEAGVIVWWNSATDQRKATVAGHKGPVYCLAFSPDSRILASCGEDKTIKIWEAVSARERAAFKGHTCAVNCVAFFPDGKTIVSGSRDCTIRFGDVASGKNTSNS